MPLLCICDWPDGCGGLGRYNSAMDAVVISAFAYVVGSVNAMGATSAPEMTMATTTMTPHGDNRCPDQRRKRGNHVGCKCGKCHDHGLALRGSVPPRDR